MATGGNEQVSYSLVKERTVTLNDADESLNPNETPMYNSLVISQDKIIIVDNGDGDKGKVKIYGLHDGNVLDMLDSDSIPRAICLKDDTTICVLHDGGLIKMASINSENVSPVFSRMGSFSLHGVFDDGHVFDYYQSVVRVNDKIVVVGVKQDTTYWCIASLDAGYVESIHRICIRSDRSSVTTKDHIIYISCYTGGVDTGVYVFDILNPNTCKYKYTHKPLRDPNMPGPIRLEPLFDLRNPTSIVINEDGIFVGNSELYCIHQFTSSCKRVSIFREEIPRYLQAMFWGNKRLYVACLGSYDITVFRIKKEVINIQNS